MLDRELYPKTYHAFELWFQQEGWGADSIYQLSEEGWNEWFPDFLRDNGVSSADEFENG